MSKLRDFVVGLPKACGVPNGLAEIYGELNGKLFDFEMAYPDGPLNRRNFSHIWDRLSIGVRPWERFADQDKLKHASALLDFAARTIDAKGGDFTGKSVIADQLTLSQANNPEVSSLLTVADASVLSNWA